MKTAPLKHIASINGRLLPESTSGDFEFKYVDISQVDSNGSVTAPQDLIRFDVAPSRARRLARSGAVVVSTVRTYLRAIGSVPISDEPLVFSTGFAVLEAQPSIDDRYLGYACRADSFVDQVVARSVGVSYPAINPSDIGSIHVPTPPYEDQRRIADFLDDRVSSIDNIIAARRQQIAQARESFDVDWAAEAAELSVRHPVVPLRRVLRSIVDGPFGSSLTSAHYVDFGTRVVRLGNLGINEFRDSDHAYVSDDYAEKLAAHSVSPGDLLIAGLGDERWPLGRACVAPLSLGPAIVKADCYRARLDERATPDFTAWYLSSPPARQQFALLSRGATRARLNTVVVREVLIPLVSLEQQAVIAQNARHAREAMDRNSDGMERSIELLTEYKQSLITAAVTGKLDVTTASTKVPA